MGQSEFFWLRRWNVDWLGYGEYAAYEFNLTPSEVSKKRLKAKVKIQVKGGYALIERPDGSSFMVYKKHKEPAPQYGTYRVLMYSSRSGFLPKVRFKFKPNWKW